MNPFDLGIRCDHLLTMAGGSAKAKRDQFVGIRGNMITTVEPWKSELETVSTRLIHESGHLVMPGLINGHSHLAMSLFRGLADDLPFSDWLFKTILPLESQLVDPEFVRAGTELALLESIRSGVTTLCEMYYCPDTAAECIDQAGLRALVCGVLLVLASPDDRYNGKNRFAFAEKLYSLYKNHPRITPCLGPHAPYTCSDELLKEVKKFCDQKQMPIHIHVSETKKEMEDSLREHGKTPTQRLFDLGLFSHRMIFAHGVHLTDADIALMEKAGTASVIYNPESNMKLGSGIAPIPKLLRAGIAVGIGTDGPASNNDLSIFGEMDTGAKLQKLGNSDNTALTAVQALRMATIEGARALGLDSQVGSIEIGKRADIITLNLESPHLYPRHDIPSLLVYSAKGSEVSTVVCDGKILYDQRRFMTLEPQSVYSKANRYQALIQKNL